MTALVFSGVRKTFGPTVALESLDLELRTGELVSLLGPSGCGKTTALRIAAGFERPDAGTVAVAGADLTNTPAHQRNMGMVFQSYSLFPNLSVGDNVEFGLRTRKVATAERAKRVADTLELVQLSSLKNRYPHQLSGGQQQRVALARALAVQPSVLLLDEPLSALDAKVRTSLRDEIRILQTELGITTLFVTHDQEEALAISDRVGVMSNGRLEQLAAPREIYRRPTNAFVARFVGSTNEFVATILGAHTVRVGPSTLTVPAASGSVGTEILVLIRPEDLTLASSADPNTLRGVVVQSSFQGASTLLTVRLDVPTTSVVLRTLGTSESHEPGDVVHVAIDSSRGVCAAVGGS